MKDTKKDPIMSGVETVHAALRDLDPEQRGRVLASVSALLDISVKQLTAAPPELPRTQVEDQRSRRLSLVEIIQDKNPGTNAQRITLFAYYREKHEGHPRFSRSDLEHYFGAAREAPSTNFDRDFVEAVKKGWIHESGEESYITSRGIEVVEAGFEGERKVSRRARGVRKSARKLKTK